MRRLIARRRVWAEWLLLALLLPVLMLWLAQRPGLRHLDGIVRDRLLQLMPAPSSGQVVTVVVDRSSLNELGPWPWPHATHAQLLEALGPLQPRSVVLDLPLDRPDPWMDTPARLAGAMARLPVYLVQRDVVGASEVELRPAPPALAAAAAGVGHARLVPDHDGVVRTLYAQEGRASHLVPYVGLLLDGQPAPPATAEAAPPASSAPTASATSPPSPAPSSGTWQRVAPFGFALTRDGERAAALSYAQVLRGEVTASQIRGRDVLVGVGADADLGDVWPVSTAQASLRLPGVALHANAIDALRTGRTVKAVDGWARVLWIVLPLVAGLVFYLRRERHAALGGMGLAGLCGLASVALLTQQWWLSPVAPVLGLMAGYLLWSWRRQALMFAYFRRQLAKLDEGLRAGEEPGQVRVRDLQTAEQHIQALDDAVERLKTLQKLFRQSLRDLPVAVLLCGRDGTVRHANPAARRLLRLRRQRDSSGRVQRLVLPAILSSLRPAGAPPLAEGHWATAHEGMQYSRAGFVFRVRCVPLGGRTHGWAVVLDDLTAEHRMQAERAQWLRFLSHDLRSPQANILSRVALDEREHPSAPGRAELAAAVRREVQRTLDLAEGFMDLGQAEAGNFAQDEVLVEAAANDAADQVWAYAQTRGVHIQVQAQMEGDAFVRGNGSLLTRALVNLLNNAIRHSAPGGRVHICIGTQGGDALLLVRDDGEGMGASQVRRLLGVPDNGLHADAPQSPSAKAAAPVRSRGIGLAVVWAVVQRHGGWVDLWSAPGAGSSFLIGLPLLTVDSVDAADEAALRPDTLF
ncbi:MAG: CHASE2 domain-containing protein [Comamonadaceae bacterium]|nr:MAG: CHASE2 domain-containing protein [Comamonadaceae bacterium]